MTIELPVRILQEDDPMLRRASAPVEAFDANLAEVARILVYAMRARRGLGLSAVQIGIPIRLIAVEFEETIVMVNPVIVRRLRRDEVQREGCLSVAPAKWKRIARPAKCEVEWRGLDGSHHRRGFSGWLARAIQHECDHLDGVLILDLPEAP